MPRKSRSAAKVVQEDTSERVTRTSLRSRSRGAAAAVMEPPKAKAKGRRSTPSPSSTTSSRSGSRRQSTSPSPSAKPTGRAARGKSAVAKADETKKPTQAKGRAAKGKPVKEEKQPALARGRRGRGDKTEEPKEEAEEDAQEEEKEAPAPTRGRGSARKGGRAAKSKVVEKEKEEATEEVEKATDSSAKSEEVVIEKSPVTGRGARGRRSAAAETKQSPTKEVADEEVVSPRRRRTATAKSPEKKPEPTPKRRSRGKAGKVAEKPEDEVKPSVEESRGKADEQDITETIEEKKESCVKEVAPVSKVEKKIAEKGVKESVLVDAVLDTDPEPMEVQPSAAAQSAEAVQAPTASPTKKRKREEDDEDVGSPPKKRKPSAEDKTPVTLARADEQAMETDSASGVDSSSAVKVAESPIVAGSKAVKEAEAVPVPQETCVPKKVPSKTYMTEPATSSHEAIPKFPAETEQLTPEAEPAEADYESFPTPPEHEMVTEQSKPVTEPDQSDESARAVPSPMPETREAEHVSETKEPTPNLPVAPVLVPEPVQSSQEVKPNRGQSKARNLAHEPDQSSAVPPVPQAMETDLSSGSAEAMPQVKSDEVPAVAEPIIIPERAQMLEESGVTPSSSSYLPQQIEPQGSEATPVKTSQREEEKLVKQATTITPVSSTMEADSGANISSGQHCDEASSFVVVNMDDVPPSESAEVQHALPPSHPAPVNDQSKSVDNVQVSSSAGSQGPAAAPPLMNNHQGTHSNAVDAINGHSGSTTSKDLLLSRKYIQNSAIDSSTLDPAKQFSLATYNILAECHLKKNDYSHAPAEVLEQGYRHRRLMLELQYLDADVFCLQEVDPDYYKGTLEPALRALGYSGEYKKRVDDYHHEGCATFYRSSRFSLVDSCSFAFKDALEKDLAGSALTEDEKFAVKDYMKDPSITLLTKLKCQTSGMEVTVANIHVAYAFYKHPDLQCVQIAYAVNRLVAMAGGLRNPHIICGDFNCESTWAPFQLARDGYLNNEMIEKLQAMKLIELPDGQKKSLVNLFWKGFQHTSPNLQSAYSTVQGKEPDMTSIDPTWSGCIDFILLSQQSLVPVGVLQTNSLEKEPALTSITANNRRCLDYIFCSHTDLNILGVLEAPSEAELTTHTRLPSSIFPSDHVSMKAELAFK